MMCGQVYTRTLIRPLIHMVHAHIAGSAVLCGNACRFGAPPATMNGSRDHMVAVLYFISPFHVQWTYEHSSGRKVSLIESCPHFRAPNVHTS